MKEQREKERILPEIERMNQLISDIGQEIAAGEVKIQKEEKSNQEIEEKLHQMEKEKDDYKDKIEALQQDFLKERDEPIRLGKGNENLKKAVEHLKSDLDVLLKDTKTVEMQLE